MEISGKASKGIIAMRGMLLAVKLVVCGCMYASLMGIGFAPSISGLDGPGIAIIGRADGPTSVFIAGKAGSWWPIARCLVAVFFLADIALDVFLLYKLIKGLHNSKQIGG